MKIVILCAGFATRLYPMTLDKPKALLNIKGRPLLDFTIEKVKDFTDEIIIVSNSKFFIPFLNWSRKHRNIKILNDHTDSNSNRLGGLGDLWYAINEKNLDDDLLVILGDNLFDFDLKDFVGTFNKNNKTLVGVYQLNLEEVKKMGEVNISDGKLIGFEEKPKNPKTGLASTGIYLFAKKDLSELKSYMMSDKPKDGPGYFVKHLSSIQDVYPYIFKGRWFDIGSLEVYNEVNSSW